MDFRSILQSMRDDLERPSRHFPEATYEEVAKNEGLRQYLIEALRLPADADVGTVRAAAIAEAERRRGSAWWIRMYGVPAEFPADRKDHDLSSVLERIYLSAPGGYGKTALFTDKLDASKRDEVIMTRSAVGVGTIAATTGLLWVIRRRMRTTRSG